MAIQQKLIIHVVQHLAPGGLEALALNMLAFSNPSQRVMIVSLEGNKADAIAHWPKLARYQNQLMFLDKPAGRSGQVFRQLHTLFRLLKPHCVHTHHIGPLLYGAVAARLAGVHTRIHTEHDAWHLQAFKHRFLQSLALKIAKPKVVADAKRVRDQIHQYFAYNDLSVIKNGVDCERFKPGAKLLARQSIGLPEDAKIIGSAGRLEPVKGHDVLVEAFSHMPSSTHLVIAGHGSERETLEDQARALGVANRITFLGLVDDMPRFYQALDVFCLPSRSEGFPLSTLEAQSCGIITVATDVGATDETLDPESGILVDSEDAVALACALESALKTSIIARPRTFVHSNNDIRQMVHAYNALTEEKRA
ncbi:glycosyl transferase [Vibrio variabilis]|uniref:Glycosyl transferase n=1 Tax=Vibrio variabilis TaxID=990271 RepID=A0ABR4YGH3_9VIBR|nr:glycosyltransferase [Vibrio variabilis]KHA62589.1 glycosyl transferase [Vibrio variabilis]